MAQTFVLKGRITVSKQRRLRIILTSKDEDSLTDIAAYFKGSYATLTHHWKLELNGQEAVRFLKAIYPYVRSENLRQEMIERVNFCYAGTAFQWVEIQKQIELPQDSDSEAFGFMMPTSVSPSG